MKAHEVRGLPVEEMKGMLVDAENNLFDLRFQHGVGQLENKLALKEKRKEIALLKTMIREEEVKTAMIKAKDILNALSSQYQISEVADVIKGEKIHADKAKLRQALTVLYAHPKRKDFVKEYQTLKNILVR